MDQKRDDAFEDESFKDDDSDVQDGLLKQKSPKLLERKQTEFFPILLAAAGHATLLLILGIVLVWAATKSRPFGVNLIDSPAREAVQYERVLIDNDLDVATPFKGEPNPEIDGAWKSILDYQYSAVLPSQLGPGQDSVELTDGTSRVLVKLDVFHSLNCLNDIRRYIFRSYYNESDAQQDQTALRNHINDCVDTIRQSLMCHADIAITTFRWKPDHLIPWPDFRVYHECRNWDRILGWAREHSVPRTEAEMLLNA